MGSRGIPNVIPFGPFDADLQAEELRKSGVRLRLPHQSFQILMMLLERPGELVTREELRAALWPADTFVDFEHGLNAAIRRLREALGDDADDPKFVETLPRRGYRYIGPTRGATKPAKPAVSPVTPIQVAEPIIPPKVEYPLSKKLTVAGFITLVIAVTGAIAWRVVSPAPKVNASSIAVLPFLDMSPQHDQEYLSDGMAEEILTNLAKIPSLKVAGRTSSFQFKGKNEDLRVIGERLNVANVLEGSVRKDGRHVRIAVELIKAKDGFYVWTNSYDRSESDLFALQDDIATAVTAALQIKLPAAQITVVREPSRSANPESYQAFLQARYFFHINNQQSLEKAQQYATRAIQLDPAFAPAYALRGRIVLLQGADTWSDYSKALTEIRQDAEKAITLAPNLPDGYQALSSMQGMDVNCPAAEKILNKARELAPADPDNLQQGALLAMCQGRLEEAVALTRQELLIDPLRAFEFLFLAQELLDLGRYEEALTALQRGQDLNSSETWMIHEIRGEVYLWQGRPQDALAEMQKEPPGYVHELGLALAYYSLGRQKESNEALQGLIDRYGIAAAYQIAQIYAYRGEVDQAFPWLDRAYKARDPGLMWFKTDPKLKGLRSDHRYAELLGRMHLSTN